MVTSAQKKLVQKRLADIREANNIYALCELLTGNENGSTLPFVNITDKQGAYYRCLTKPPFSPPFLP